MNAAELALLGAGVFLLTGMLSGIWKYRCMMRSADGTAPTYVDITHRTALLYAFASLVLAEFARHSPWPPAVNLVAVAAPLLFFAAAVSTYAIHGWLRDTDNQMRRPHVLGRRHLPSGLIHTFMALLIVGEVGGFGVLFAGFVYSLAM
jgi:hypothetical protein